jgi:hypothetical protein
MTIGCSSVRHLLIAATVLLTHPVQAQGGFEPFSALSNGKDCSINLGFPSGSFCGIAASPSQVQGWSLDQQTDYSSQAMLSGQRFDFSIVVKSSTAGDSPTLIPIRFLNPGTAKRFYIQFGLWSGQRSMNGTNSPFPDWLDLQK